MDVYGSTPYNLIQTCTVPGTHPSHIPNLQNSDEPRTHPRTACIPEQVVCANVDKATGNDVEMT